MTAALSHLEQLGDGVYGMHGSWQDGPFRHTQGLPALMMRADLPELSVLARCRHTQKAPGMWAGCSFISLFYAYSMLVASPSPLNLTDLTVIVLVSSTSSKVSYSDSGTFPSKTTV